MSKEICPVCKKDLLRTSGVGNFFYFHCWGCNRDFTKNLLFELKEIKSK